MRFSDWSSDVCSSDLLSHELPRHEYLGEAIRAKLHYFPAVTREPFAHQGRLTTLLENGEMAAAAGLPALSPEHDRVMICGSPQMLADTRALLDARGFRAAPRIGQAGHYVFERAFVER